MPTYDYQCKSCGPFEVMRRIADRNKAAACPQCGSSTDRILISAPSLADMSSEIRIAMATNEKASHEPTSSSSIRHPKGCGCCKTAANTSTAPKSFANRRPWMISH